MQFDGFQQNTLLPGTQIQIGQNLPLHYLARTYGMFHIFLDIFGERSPIMQVDSQLQHLGVIGNFRADLFDQFEKSFGMSNRPCLPSFPSHVDNILKSKVNLNHSNILSSVYLDPSKIMDSPPKTSCCTVTSNLSPVNLN